MKRVAIGIVVGLLGAAATTTAMGETRIPLFPILTAEVNGGFAPKALPRQEEAPVTLSGAGEIAMADGSSPPALREIEVEFDRHGHLDTTGLPVCTRAQINRTTVASARRTCREAIVGEGEGTVVLAYPENSPIPVVTPITIFNGPKKAGRPTALVHGRIEIPRPTTYVVPVAIERIGKGAFGFRVIARVPIFGDGYGYPVSASLKVGRRWTVAGEPHSYVNARCKTGVLQAQSKLSFEDGRILVGTVRRPCAVAVEEKQP